MVDKRRPIQLLPGVNQTDTLTKFFASTVDHMFQPESAEFISAYIGEKPFYYNGKKDYYVNEPNKPRSDYQLPATAVSADQQSGVVNNVMFYYDYLLNLQYHGALTNNHSRLFDQEYYSWAPPIDLDKMLNYTKYVWVPGGPRAIQLLGRTNAHMEIIGKTSYTYTGPYRLTSTNELINGTLSLSSGMVIEFLDDADPTLHKINWVIERVGRSMMLCELQPVFCPAWDTWPWDIYGWDGDSEQYIKDYQTVGRSNAPTNGWSIRNVWFHEDIIKVSKTYVDFGSARATRPIIEFDYNLQLYNSGSHGIAPVTLICDNLTDFLGTIVGKPRYKVDGVELKDGYTILVTGDADPWINNRIYTVGGIESLGEITLFQRGSDPVRGDCVRSIFGNDYENIVLHYDGTRWIKGQQYSHYTAPLFNLYDYSGVGLDDVGAYPGSNFEGNTIFAFALDKYATTDPETQLKLKRDQFGSLVFDNSIWTQRYSYQQNYTDTEIIGYYWYQANTRNGERYNNGWDLAPLSSRQYIVNSFNVVSDTYKFTIDQSPSTSQTPLPTIYVSRITNSIETKLQLDIDFTFEKNVVLLKQPAKYGDRIIIRSWSRSVPTGRKGHYELPLNLTANPNNSEVESITFSQFEQHFVSIIENQTNFVGNALSNNNYRDSARERGYGTKILQHRGSLLRPMILSSSNVTVGINSVQSSTDPMLAMQWAQREYTRFYNRFITSLCKLWRNGYSAEQAPSEWISNSLKQLNLGKTANSAWANSGPEGLRGAYTYRKSQSPTFVPPTATRLGMSPAYYPSVTLSNGILVIQCHDGARLVMSDLDGTVLGTLQCAEQTTSDPSMLSNPVAAAWLQFELDLYNNMPARYNAPDATMAFDARVVTPGKWRRGDYTRQEFLSIQAPMFDRWIIANQVDYQSHSVYDINDPFTWNYTSVRDFDGATVPGHWQGIYRWFYDTDRPHTHPWEMLGFSQEPSWWQSEYGPAPYTRGNTKLWEDLRDGLIRQGYRAGVNTAWVRSGLLRCIPVDDQGELLAPFDAGCLNSLPSEVASKDDWQFGDGSPMESVWVHSLDYNFVYSQYSYLMKPARFVEYNWDPLRGIRVQRGLGGSQWIYTDTGTRRPLSQFYVHRENPSALNANFTIPDQSTSSYFGSGGLQHWISEYLVNLSLNVTAYLGRVVRGTNVQLAHQMGGFVTKNLYLTADSFGKVGYSNQIIPKENVKIYLYKSNSVNTSFYSGVVVTKMSTGWRVVGYDGINQFFTIIPSNLQGSKSTIVVGNDRATWYKVAKTTTATVPYGTVFQTKQEVFDFLVSLQRYQESQGWVFDQFEPSGNYIYDWLQSGREFLFWSQGNWANGNFIALSPLATGVKFIQKFGNIQFLSGIVAGTYPVIDKAGSHIDGQNLDVLRYDDTITVKTFNEQAIFGLRLFTSTLENIVLIDNKTSFGDTVFDPLYNLSQPRLKLYAYRTNGWNGRLDSPGYFLYQDSTDNQWTLLPNFEKTTNDFTKYFNIEQPKNYNVIDNVSGNIIQSGTSLAGVDSKELRDISNHQIGYQSRGYLDSLLLEDSTEFQFYQGFIKQKGTTGTLDRLVRNESIVPVNSDFTYYEEYAFRNSRFGSTAVNITIDFIVPQNQYLNNPQQITVYGTQDSNRELDGVITLIPHDPKIVVPPSGYNSESDTLFGQRTFIGPDLQTDLPTVGYVMSGDTTWVAGNVAAFSTFWENTTANGAVVNDRDTIWQYVNEKQTWNVWQFNQSNASVLSNDSSQFTGNLTVINTTDAVDFNVGDVIVLSGVSNVNIDGTWTVHSIASNKLSFTIPTYTYDVGTGGSIYVYRPVRFANTTARDLNPPIGGWKPGDRAWVDKSDFGLNGWTVYQLLHGMWSPIRTEQYKIDPRLMYNAKLYSASNQTLHGVLEYYDPAKGYIPGIAQKNLSYISVYDPATYNRGDDSLYPLNDARAWGKNRIGETWWDLSAVRYIDYEQGSLGYRWQNWGKIAQYTSIDVYEWVQSPVDPIGWATYVSTGRDFSQFGIDYAPSGTIAYSDSPAYTVVDDYSEVGTPKTYYYFWVKNAITLPLPPNRSLTTQSIGNIIGNPTSHGVRWYAAIDQRNIIVSNIGDVLRGTDTVLGLIYTTKMNDLNDYKEWELVRPNDQFSHISDYHWDRMRASLTGKDGLGNNVPDQYLGPLMKYGNLARPRQTWFVDSTSAAAAFVTKVNQLLADQLLEENLNADGWLAYFTAAEQPPAADSGAYQYQVNGLMGRDALVGDIKNGQSVLVLKGLPYANIWVIYRYDESTDGSFVWTATQAQSYNTNNYWKHIDWYRTSSGVTSTTIPNYTVVTLSDRTQYEGTVGTIVRVTNKGDGTWGMYQWTADGWLTVGYQDGTIQILSAIYDNSIDTMSWGQGGFDTVAFDRFPWVEFGNIFDGLRNLILSRAELNSLFFTMVDHVLAEQKFVDWVIKTSYVSLRGFNIPLIQDGLYRPDNTQAILDYFNEVKPYHVKVRQFLTSRSAFDNVTVQTSEMRNMKATLLFDRISEFGDGWDVFPWSVYGWDATTDANGAINRINRFYQPVYGQTKYLPAEDLIRKDDSAILPTNDYRGIIHNGTEFAFAGGWGNGQWDPAYGWEGKPPDVPELLDIMITGGLDPVYDTFYTDGIQTEFRLAKQAQDPEDLVVWADKDLKHYGTDWILPNWIDDISIIRGGSGYNIGDKLEVRTVITSADVAGWAFSGQIVLSPARFTVTGVDYNGAITYLRMDSKGSYDYFSSLNVELVYQPFSSGTGANAKVAPLWGGDTLLFLQPPASSDRFNVHVLYVGSTFAPAPEGELDIINEGGGLVDPIIQPHPEELYKTRLQSSTRMDVYTQQAGGSPRIWMQIYQLDGVRDHFPLNAVPMNIDSVIVIRDDLLLAYGLARDYVIDFATNQVVFMNPPTGKLLHITTIETGGGNLGTYIPSVVTPGVGYRTNDIVSLAGGSAINDDIATVRVTSVKGVKVHLTDGGKGYRPGDILLLKDDNDTNKNVTLELTVTDTLKGAITAVEISQTGSYIYVPTLHEWTTPGLGVDAVIEVDWGIEHVARAHVGNYDIHPIAPIHQLATTGNGVGATFATLYTSIIANKVFTADGVSSSYDLGDGMDNSKLNQLLVTVDGVRIVSGVNGNLNASGTVLTISPRPVAYATVAITQFNTDTFSLVCEQEIVVNGGQYDYVLLYPPKSTVPPYLSSTVTLNGLDMQGPRMDVFKADGYEHSFNMSVPATDPNYIIAYFGRHAKTINSDFTVADGVLSFNTTPPAGTIITLVYVDPAVGYNYKIENNMLRLQSNPPAGNAPRLRYPQPGDVIKVITYSEDSSYGMRVEQFNGPCYPRIMSNKLGVYMLADMPYSDVTTLAWVNNDAKTLMYEYEITRMDLPGWDIADWDVFGWQDEYPNSPVIRFGGNIAHSETDRIQVQYTTGLPGKPHTAWRNIYVGQMDDVMGSTVIYDRRKTKILTPIMIQSTSIEVEDVTVLFSPDRTTRGMVWIGNERITYRQIRPAPTVDMPNRGFLVGIERGTFVTPKGNVSTLYDTIFYDGDGSTTHFPTISGSIPGGGTETVFVDDVLQIDHAVVDSFGTYQIKINPIGFSAGRYVVFDKAPPVGWRNVKLAAPKIEAKRISEMCHPIGSVVIDASPDLNLPGGYNWLPTPDGLQYSDTVLGRWLTDHPGTRS